MIQNEFTIIPGIGSHISSKTKPKYYCQIGSARGHQIVLNEFKFNALHKSLLPNGHYAHFIYAFWLTFGPAGFLSK
jgi:hypothetical protein